MRIPFPIVALVAALLTFGPGGSAQTQQQNQPAPDAPQPQKKAAPKAQPADPQTQPTNQPASKADDGKHSTAQDNPFPEDVSRGAAKAASGEAPKNSTAKDNPFPEDVSRDAAKAAGNETAPKPDVPAGVSSSQSSSSSADGEMEPDPGRAKKDADVGGFYLKSGDYQGALLRYKDATMFDPGNVEAIFGKAEAERMLKKNADAARDYQLYLDIVPNGPKSKQALKALKTLPPG
jgi:hypothetical protein